MNKDFSDYSLKKKEYDEMIDKLNKDKENSIIEDKEYQIELKKIQNNFRSYLGPLYKKAKDYVRDKLEYDIDIYTVYEGYNVQMVLADIQAIMTNEEYDEVAKTLQYKIKNGNFDPDIIENLNIIYDLLGVYHSLLLIDAPERIIPDQKELEIFEEKKGKPTLKKEKEKVNFFIKFLPSIIFFGLLIIAYIIYYYFL